MTNHDLRNIINEIETTQGLNISQIAKKADVNRSNLSKIINMDEEKDIGKRLLSKLKTGFPGFFKETNKNNTTENYILPMGEVKITLADYIRMIEDYNKYLQESVLSNLKLAVGYMGKLDTQFEASRDVALKSLARLEKKPEGLLTGEADKAAQQKLEELNKQGIAVGKRK